MVKMTEDSYSEYAVTVRQTGGRRAGQTAVVGATAVSLMLALTVSGVFLALTAVGAVGCYWAYLCSDMEYETIFLDGMLEISAVYRKSRRRKLFQCEMKNVTEYRLGRREDVVRQARITRDYTSRAAGCVCCAMKIADGKGTQVVCFEPGETLEAILESRYPMLRVIE